MADKQTFVISSLPLTSSDTHFDCMSALILLYYTVKRNLGL